MKKARFKIYAVSLLFTIFSIGPACAQTTLQVISKTIADEVVWKEGVKLEINGDNAEIHCEAYEGNTIQYEIQFIAKHPEKEKAENDLGKMKWISGRQGKTLFMRNYIELSQDETRPESNLKAIYHIKIPEQCPLTINNYFGEIIVKNIQNYLIIKSEFAAVTLNNIKGDIDLESKFGDITATSLEGNIQIISNRSNINLSEISGLINIEAIVAEISLDKIHNLNRLNITAEKSETRLSCGNNYRFVLGLKKVDFDKPDWMKIDSPQKNDIAQKSNFIAHPEYPIIDMKLTIGTLEIK